MCNFSSISWTFFDTFLNREELSNIQEKWNYSKSTSDQNISNMNIKKIYRKINYNSPPARWGLLDFIRVILLLFLLLFLHLLLVLLLLLHHFCLHFHVYFHFANFRTQWALLDLNWEGLSALGTAGSQPGTFRAQWAPLDLNLGPSELCEHRWTSTWDPPSSVSTTGPQPGTLRAQWAPLALNCQIESQKICQIKYQKEYQKICQII